MIKGTTVDGPGFRTSIYFAGCRHQCRGCHNPESWDFNVGEEYDIDGLLRIIADEDFDVTLSGGDPLYQTDFIKELVNGIKKLGHTVWIYTGFRWEELMKNPELKEAIREVDVIVDSPFILELRNPDLMFRGSSNQRIIDVKKSFQNHCEVVLRLK